MIDFYKRIVEVCKRIPDGKVATYGQIALLCGRPQNARQVGYALHKQITEEIPAHRVVNHQGCLSGASAFEQPDLQKLLLEEEGVTVDYVVRTKNYKVDLKYCQWRPSLENVQKMNAFFEQLRI